MSVITLSAATPTTLFQFTIETRNPLGADELTDYSSTTSPSDFTMASGTDSSTVEVIAVTNTGTGKRTIKVHPEMTPGQSYSITVPAHTGTNTASFSVATGLITADHPLFPAKPLETITHACGQIFQQLVGVPETIVIQDFDPSAATTLFCETSLGFPAKGALYVNEEKYNYTGRFSGGFTGVTRAVALGIPNDVKGVSSSKKAGAGSLVRFDITSHEAEDSLA